MQIDKTKIDSRRMLGILQHDDTLAQNAASQAEVEIRKRGRSRSIGNEKIRIKSGQAAGRPNKVSYGPLVENAYGNGYESSNTMKANQNRNVLNESLETQRRQPLEVPVLGEAGYIGRNLPNSISEQHLVGVSEKQRQSDNKALLHDIDIRFENQDRTINYLLQQINSMEQAV